MIKITFQLLAVFFMNFNLLACQPVSSSKAGKAIVSDDGASAIEKKSSLKTVRSVHTATLLQDGTVLVAGGMDNGQTPTGSAEIFDPQTNVFQSIAGMNAPRVGHVAVLLKNGNVLIAGGFENRKPTSSAEIFDAKTKTFRNIENMKIARGGHTGTLLQDGKVLITGSENGEKEAELFDVETGKFSLTGTMNVSRLAHTATLLENGNVLIAGGSFDHNLTNTAEIYDKNTNKFSLTAEMPVPRHKHAAILLDDGNVLIAGGSDSKDWNGQYASALIFETKKSKFKNAGDMNNKRFKIASAAAKLPGGDVLIAGGGEQAEIFDYKTEKFSVVAGKMDETRFYTTATTLKDGRVLIIGGYNRQIKSNGNVWLYNRASAENLR